MISAIIGFIVGAGVMLLCVALCSAAKSGEWVEPMEIEKKDREDE